MRGGGRERLPGIRHAVTGADSLPMHRCGEARASRLTLTARTWPTSGRKHDERQFKAVGRRHPEWRGHLGPARSRRGRHGRPTAIGTSTKAPPASAGSTATTAMTTDTVFAIFSTTKAITGTAVLQLRRGRQARPRRAGEDLRARDRQAAGHRRLRRERQAEAARAQARRHDAHADAAHRRLRLRLLQRDLQPAGAGERAAQRHHGVQGRADDAAALRSRRTMGIRLQHRLVRPGRRGHHAASGSARSSGRASSSRSACGHRLSSSPTRCAPGSQACTREQPTAR